MKIVSVVGARPNFMKIAPLARAVEAYNSGAGDGIDHILVHTGQHYDNQMSRSFFETLNIPEADINLGIGSGSHAEQVGQTMMAFEKVLWSERPDWVVVVGDVNATLACSVAAKKEWVKCCHIEAGLRSGDMTMPEEINRLVTDRLSDLLLTPDDISSENLRREGVLEERIILAGNIMIDTLESNRHKAETLTIEKIINSNIFPGQDLPQNFESFILMTMHRPSNVDQEEILGPILDFLIDEVARDFPLFWPVHPRAAEKMKYFGLWDRALKCSNLLLLAPLGYLEMLCLNMSARLMLTDSGGLQEECCVLGTPSLTLRWNTERPVTLQEHGGVCMLVGNDVGSIRKGYQAALHQARNPSRPPLWDGNAAERCLKAILQAS